MECREFRYRLYREWGNCTPRKRARQWLGKTTKFSNCSGFGRERRSEEPSSKMRGKVFSSLKKFAIRRAMIRVQGAECFPGRLVTALGSTRNKARERFN